MIMAALAAQAATTPSAPPASTEVAVGPQAGSSTYVDLEAGAGYSTNPFLSFGGDTGRGFGRISAHGVYTRVSARTTTVLSGFAQNTTYTGRYGSAQSFDLNARHEAAVSERLRLFGDADFAYDEGGQLDTRILGIPDITLVPGTAVPPVLVLPGSDFLTVTGRTYRESGHFGGQLALSPNESLTMSSGIEHVLFKTAGLKTSFTTIPVSIGYDRKVSARATIGAEVTAQRTDYNGPSHYEVISPQLTGQLNLSEQLTLRGAVGASFASIDDGIATSHSSGLTASASLCSATEHGHLCAHGSIDQATATSAGPSKSVSAGMDFARQLDADQTIQLSLAVDHYSNPASIVTGHTFSSATYLRGVADYSRRLGNRWFGGLNLAARKVTQNGPDPDADISASLFIRYRFGDVQ